MIRRKIHTNIKVLAYLNALPAEYRKQLHVSQMHRYRQMQPAGYFGHELETILNKELDWIKQFGDFPKAKQISIGILKLFVFFRSVVSKTKGFKTALNNNRFFFIELFQRFREFIPARSFSKMIGIDESTLYHWVREVRIKCCDSIINHCRNVHPNQLLETEVSAVKKLLVNEEYKFWPLSSLYYFALKNKIVCLGKSTWYKYATLISASRLRPKTVKTKTTGIRASKPNELWHADITYFVTAEKIKLYIYTVIDNFSRLPLCVKVSDTISGKFRVHTFREALTTAVKIDPSIQNLQLMTDGGSENFNGNVNDFLNNINTVKIKHIKALSDGWPSNSMAEAFNYTLKIFYLNNMEIKNIHALNTALEFVINDYCGKRPHGALKGLTPLQAYTGQRPDDVSFTEQLQSARKMRVIMNQNHNCSGKCQFKEMK